MIKNKKDLLYYLEEDKRSLGKSKRKRPYFIGEEIWKFEIVLRKHEYYSNINCNVIQNVLKIYYAFLHYKKGIKLGFSIPVNTFGHGLRINHYRLLVVNQNARIGKNCDIHQGVNIGQNKNAQDVPTIGDNVWIGPGAKIFGKITIPDCAAIGANAVVTKSFFEKNITLVGSPARKLKDSGTLEMATAKDII
ncbi:MAG: cysEA [Sporomusa sp.]|jgi:serine O-acetyltransferase|nr:cysEA [Sporomusa sp.]